MSGQGIQRRTFEGCLKASLALLLAQEGVIASPLDQVAVEEKYQRLCVFLDLSLEAAGVKMAPRPAELKGRETTTTQPTEGQQDATHNVRVH